MNVQTLIKGLVITASLAWFSSGLAIADTSCISDAGSGLTVKVDKKSGEYTIYFRGMNWWFKGTTDHKLTNVNTSAGSDETGSYEETVFSWEDSIFYEASIKWYPQQQVIFFSEVIPRGSNSVPKPFPSFTTFPKGMHTFSYQDINFAPFDFKLHSNSTPWLFFDHQMSSFVISPASDFIVSKLSGNGKDLISSGLNPGIRSLPENFTHTTILVVGRGIRETWDTWGKALRSMYKRNFPVYGSDPLLKYFGYWTDNGAAYYYNYDLSLGYAQTLLSLRKRYIEENIPMGYMQLDSWWYEKSIYDVNGQPDADHKNPLLPSGKWNRYGGLMNYTADAFLFPDGLSAFQKALGIPLVTHNRWIDPSSPYHKDYSISGYAAVDSSYWTHIITYIKKAGVTCYEQDWLDYIYEKSPEMGVELSTGNSFTDGMARACKNAGLTMQYCMATPRYFLQGLKYNNLTTIRTSGDRFEPGKWKDFLYASEFAYECGIYPWCDVFNSAEQGNMILSVLSAGPVGTGDILGKEDKSAILLACRNDGVLVKPDMPVLPVDQDYIDDAENARLPMLAYTYSQHHNITTDYLFAFAGDSVVDRNIRITPSKYGLNGNVLVYDFIRKQFKLMRSDSTFTGQLGNKNYGYYILAPVTQSGIAFIGDVGKIVTNGKERIATIEDSANMLTVKVLFAKGESLVQLEGYSENPLSADKGQMDYNSVSHIFSIQLPSDSEKEVTVKLKPTPRSGTDR